MTTLKLELPEHLARQLADADQKTVLEALEIGLQQQATSGAEQVTEHPYIHRVPGINGGRPIIRGSRIPVWQVAEMIVHSSESVEDYLADHPHLTSAKIHDALSYYFDHREEIEQEIVENRTQNVMKEFGFTMDERGFVHFNDNQSLGSE